MRVFDFGDVCSIKLRSGEASGYSLRRQPRSFGQRSRRVTAVIVYAMLEGCQELPPNMGSEALAINRAVDDARGKGLIATERAEKG
jgi:hypothetical protein